MGPGGEGPQQAGGRYHDDRRPQEEDKQGDRDHLRAHGPAHDDHPGHHLHQALLLRGGPGNQPDDDADDDNHLHDGDIKGSRS